MRSILFGLTLLMSAAALASQSAQVRDLVREAEALAQAGDFTRALKSVQAANARCELEKAPQCEAYIAFAAGFISQTAAETADDEEQRLKLLRMAVDFYDESLQRKETIDALENLATVLLDLGEFDRVLGLAQNMIRINPDGASDYLVAAAFVTREMGDAARAEQYLRQAVAEDPSSYDAREMLVELHLSADLETLTAEQRRERLSAVLGLGIEQARDGFADLAVEAYDAVIRESWQSAESLALEALVEWVDAHAGGGDEVPPLSELPVGWISPPVAQLRAIVEQPENAAQAAWWTENDVRKHAVASLLLALVTQSEMEPVRAIAILEAAERIAPDPTRYRSGSAPAALRWRRIPLFDVLAKLAPLYLDNDTGPRDRRFESLTSRVTSRSLRAALRGDFLTLHRYYATVGLLLDERQMWTGRLNSAGYHLRNAIMWADTQDRTGSAQFQPVPDLRRRLATGLLRNNETDEAAVHFIGAAADYLDIDDLDSARRMYDEAMRIHVTFLRPSRRERLVQVRTALEARELVRRLTGPDQLTFAGILTRAEFAWLFTRRVDDQPFVGRQRYKTLMSLAERAEELIPDDPDEGMRFRMEAVAVARDLKALGSGVDVENLRKTGRRLMQSTNGRSQMQLAPRLSAKQFEKVWTYGGGERVGGFDIGWDDDLLIAAEAQRVLLYLSKDVRPTFRVDQEKITLFPAAGSYDLAPTVTKLEELDDVEQVMVSPPAAGM